METLITILIVVIILGALMGGKSFGGTVRKGCGFLILLVIILAAIGIFFYWHSVAEMDTNNKEAVSSSIVSAYFIVKQDCQTYTKPNVKSDISGHLEEGEELYVANINKFNYFYELSYENGENRYVKKECLEKK